MAGLRISSVVGALLAGAPALPSVAAGAQEDAADPVSVYLLVGQSNMQGKGEIEHLRALATDPATAATYGHWLRDDGTWVVRDDVWIWNLGRTGGLTVGHGAPQDRFGPELQIGAVLGDASAAPVLLVKIAWGGQSLAVDFRPPSAGGEVGPRYTETVAHARDVLARMAELLPELAGRAPELRGVFWFQGWNDRVNQGFNDQYEQNLAHLIRDLRRDLGAPGLPFVIGETGQGGVDETHPRALSLMRAQAAVAALDEFRGNVALVETKAFYDSEPSHDGGYHFFGNAANFFRIGDALGKAMLALQRPPSPVWIWADFEVVGYGTHSREELLVDPPITLGTPFSSERRAAWKAWGERLRERLNLAEVHCSAVRYADFRAYLLVDVVERGDEQRTHVRAAPTGELELANLAVRDTFARLQARSRELFERGDPPAEFLQDGAKTFADEQMAALALELRVLVPAFRENLLEVVAESADAEERAAAATMLHWGGDVLDSVARVHVLLDDPDGGVRNNIARFMLFHVARVEDPDVRRSIVTTLATMIERPSHGDRNKGLYGLLHVAQAFPDEASTLLAPARESIARIAQQSVLSNVQGPADELLAILDE